MSVTSLLLFQITRIMGAEEASPYDILGVNNNMSAENMKKRYADGSIQTTSNPFSST